MSNFPSYFYVFSILLQLLIGTNNPSFKPGKRFEHTATVIDNKLFILGGFGEEEGKEFFYLDVSSPFTTQDPLWNDITDLNTLEAHSGATSVNGGVNNNSIILYGGVKYDNTSDNSPDRFPLIHIFDVQDNSWNIPVIPGQEQIFSFVVSGVINNNGQMYILEVFNSQMIIFDTVYLTLSGGSSMSRFTMFYDAVLLPDQNIVYFTNSDKADPNLSEVLIYNIIDDIWLVQKTTGNIPSNRTDFSAVLALDGQRVIVFGGIDNNYNLIPREDALYVLDTENFEWYIPKVSGDLPARSDHKANVIGDYMVVTFGLFYYDDVHILLLNISNNDEYIWTTEFVNMAIQIKFNIFYFMIVLLHVLYHLL